MNRERVRTVVTASFIVGVVGVGGGIVAQALLSRSAESDAVAPGWPGWVLIGVGVLSLLVAAVIQVVLWVSEPDPQESTENA